MSQPETQTQTTHADGGGEPLDEIAAAYEARVAAVPEAARRFAEEAWGKTWAHAEMGSLLDFAALAAPAAKGGTEVPGWKLVPLDPTPKMVAATWDDPIDTKGGIESQNARNKRVYAAMLAASPTPPAGADGGGSGNLAALSAGAWEYEWHNGFEWLAGLSSFDPRTNRDPNAGALRNVRQIPPRSAPAPDIGAQGEPASTMERPNWPQSSFDSHEWAKAFCKRFKVIRRDGRQDDGDDIGLMIGWFANALMRGFDESARRSAKLADLDFTAGPTALIQPMDHLSWAVSRWRDEVERRPLHNVHRRTLDDTWRQVIRYLGADPDALIGPSHDDLIVATDARGEMSGESADRDEIAEVRAMLLAGQGDDGGPKIAPALDESMSLAAMVESCLHLLEHRRDALMGQAAPAPDIGAQGEPVAWAWEGQSVTGHWYFSLSAKKPAEGPFARNIRPLYDRPAPAAPRSGPSKAEIKSAIQHALNYRPSIEYEGTPDDAAADAILALLQAPRPGETEAGFATDQRVRKTKGSSWQGRVCGFYRTDLTPDGICVESEREPGSVQIYPASALEPAPAQAHDAGSEGGE